MTRSPIAYGLTVLFMLFTVACKGDGADGVQLNPTAVDVYSTVTRHVVTTSRIHETAGQALL